ncbi:hemolysin family protein [Streptomonospora nanhaiensis]|uniref:CBS domain containing-hemolysin-like protein n=1 Tax=Streptomonospora nanhaiensis TaxID=1323731 RepID=A0A853BGG2_9ACTN|nr:hemolysin family protein [Streptomonospora nanhaiensis]MBV2366310.1 hemolysin family protein [Streptomonospora nanhaiensis]MBX9387926.1 hemolysin family protein [Streptomonospora nanhaiensis]NYI94439.1 CBS domain containing-hemolysin-like protein [Streptomonospora nanhaiensis]
MSDLNPALAMLITVAIIGLSAFFVAIEFALVAARRYRLEEAAETSLSARAALKSARDLSLLLAGSQLGITLCTLALGAITKPAVEHMLEPLFSGLPEAVSHVAAFIVALVLVTFVHLVVGEMAPKSWAISHPERSATLLALPMRAFMWLTRPALVVLNGLANWTLHRVGVQAVDEVAGGHGPDDLRELVDHSAKAGALDEDRRDQLATALEVNSRPLREITTPREELAAVAPSATLDEVKRVSRESGHLRLVVREGEDPVGVLHVRDALTSPPETTAADLMRPVLTLEGDTPIYAALGIMRESRTHLALVEEDGVLAGLVTMQDMLDRLLVIDSPA